MKIVKSSIVFGLVLAVLGSYYVTIQAQDPGDVEVNRALDHTDAVDNFLSCGGFCDSLCMTICGARLCATFAKATCVGQAKQSGVTDPCQWVRMCGSNGNSDVGTIRMNEAPDAQESGFLLESVKGEGPFEYPANVTVHFYAELDVNGFDRMTNSEPILLRSVAPINEWPPKEEVMYTLVQPVEFTNADGTQDARIDHANVRMKHNGTTVTWK